MNSNLTTENINQYIDAMRHSGAMGKSARRLRLLQHLLIEESRGEGDALKAYSIALDVFDKPDDFDPSSDSIVRVEIGRLRSAIAVFEGSKFADTEIKVEIPTGTYRPQVELRSQKTSKAPSPPAAAQLKNIVKMLAALIVIGGIVILSSFFFLRPDAGAPFEETISLQLGDFEGDKLAGRGVAMSLRSELSKSSAITVTSISPATDQTDTADFALRGLITESSTGQLLNTELVNLHTNSVVWAKSARFNGFGDFDGRMSQGIADEIRVHLFGASKEVLEGRDPETLTPAQLFVLATWVPGPATNTVDWEQERVDLMDLALTKDPDFGAAHSVLADKLAYLASIYGPSDRPELRQRADFHGKRALELSPLNPDVVFNVAQSHWHSGRITESHETMKRVLELYPGHDLARFLKTVIPYTCEAAPDDILAQAKMIDAKFSADNPIRWLSLTWISWLHTNRDEFELALINERQAAQIFEIPYTFMRHAMLLNKLGMPQDAAKLITRQKSHWPDIDPQHFAEVTYTRLCQESPQNTQYIENYQQLADAMRSYL